MWYSKKYKIILSELSYNKHGYVIEAFIENGLWYWSERHNKTSHIFINDLIKVPLVIDTSRCTNIAGFITIKYNEIVYYMENRGI